MDAGYGHIAPRTALGRVVTMVYATFGIPLTLLTIAQVGQYMAAVFRFTYKNVMCGLGGGVCVSCRRTPSVTENTHVVTTTDHPDSDTKSCSSRDPPLSSACNHQTAEGHDQGQSKVQDHEGQCMDGVSVQSDDDDGQVVQLDIVKG